MPLEIIAVREEQAQAKHISRNELDRATLVEAARKCLEDKKIQENRSKQKS